MEAGDRAAENGDRATKAGSGAKPPHAAAVSVHSAPPRVKLGDTLQVPPEAGLRAGLD
jgi:hypothetical protein